MAGRSLPRRLFVWVKRWWLAHFAPRRRPVTFREEKPLLEALEQRFAPISLASAAPPALASADVSAPPASGSPRSRAGADAVPAAEQIQLVSPPPATSESGTTVAAGAAQGEPSFAQQFWSRRDTAALDALFSGQPTRRPVAPSAANQGTNPPNAQALAGGGAGPGGRSTPNAGLGGGGGGGGGGAGPAVTNASQWLSANLGGTGTGPAAGATTASGPTGVPAGHAAAHGGDSAPTPASSGAQGHPATAASSQAAEVASVPAHPLAALAAPSARHPHGHDPLYVLDMNTGETVPANVTLNSFSNWGEDLLAQVSAAAVTGYSWDTSGAPDLTNVSGAGTDELQGTWASFTGGARTDTITLTETAGASQLSQTMTFLVAGTDSPGYSSSRPTGTSTWPSVLTPDQVSAGQATRPGGPDASLGLADGSVRTSFSMPSYNPNADPLQLDYSSTAAGAQPIFLVRYQLPSTMPTTVTAQLTLDNTLFSTVSYDPSSLNPGDWMQMDLQANASGLGTGRYPYQVSVSNGTSTVTYTGSVDVVNQASSAYGSGWSLGGVEQLVPVSGSGVILVEPGGTSLWFANGQQSGTFVSPAGDFSTLVQNQDGSYTRTLTDGTQVNFGSGGLQTSVVDRDGNTTSYGYSASNRLTAVTDLDGQQTTLAYNASGELTSVTDPAGRGATLAYDTGGRLTAITDPAGASWGYGYDGSSAMTALTDPRNNTTTFGYDFAHRVTGVTQADGTTEQLAAVQTNGLAASGSGNVTATLWAAGDQASYTDPNSQVWLTGLGWLGFGQNVSDADPLGDTSLTYRDTNGLAWLGADPLGRRTRDFFDSKGNVTEDVAADDTTQQYQYNSFAEVTRYTDQENDVTTYAYNARGDQTQLTDALNHSTTYAYNAAGLVTSETDPLGHTTTSAYDSLNRLTRTTDALGGSTTYAYDNAGDQTSTTDARGFTSTSAYDPMGRVTSQTVPVGGGLYATTTFAYDRAGDQTAATDPLGHQTTTGYDKLGRQTGVTDPLGHATTYGYDAAGNQTSVTDPLGRQTTYGFDAAGRQTSMTDPAGDQTTSAYDAAGEQTSVTDPLGDQTVTTYTARGEQASQTLYNPLGTAVRKLINTYFGCGCLSTVTAVNLGLNGSSIGGGFTQAGVSGSYTGTLGGSLSGTFTTSFSGNVLGSSNRVIGSFSGTLSGTLSGILSSLGTIGNGTVSGSGTFTLSGGVTGSGTVSFNAGLSGTNGGGSGTISGSSFGSLSGNISSSGDASGTLSGQLSFNLSGGGGTTSGMPGSFTGTTAQATSYQQDALHRVTAVTDASGATTSFAFDAAGNQTGVTDPLGHATTYGYNAVNGRTATTDALGDQATYGYDSVGNQTAVTDPMGRTTTSTFDAQGRLLAVTDPRGAVTSYGYDLAGDQTSITDPVGNQTTYGFDAAGRQTIMTDPLGHSATYAYDAAGQQTSVTDRDGRTTTSAYDQAGRLTGQTWVGGSYTATYTYDKNGQLTGAQDPNSQYTYTYDVAGDVLSADNGGTPGVPHVVLNYGYDSFGNRTSMSDNLGGGVTYVYDADNRLQSLGLSVTSTLDAQAALGYDQASRMTAVTRTGASGGDTITSSLGYDNADRLTNITHADASKGTTLANYTYGYDKASQLTSYQDSNSSLTYGYDNSGELASATGTLDGSGYSVSYGYDLNGNRNMTGYTTGKGNELQSDGTYSYTYDNEGNLVTQVTIATGSVTYYSYDYENRLTEVKQETSGGTVINDEKFTYDVNDNRIGAWLNGTQQSWTAFDGANPYVDFNGSGSVTQRYVTYPNGLNEFYGQVNAGGTTQWFLTDNLASIRQVVSSSGSALDTIAYDPYGNIISQTSSTYAPRFLYAGGTYDSITMQYLFGARWENSQDGRWESLDPIGFQAGDTNLYRYVENDPTNMVDVSGEISLRVVSTHTPVVGKTGLFVWPVKFVRTPIGKAGVVLQHVIIHSKVTGAKGINIKHPRFQEYETDDYWEAWDVPADAESPQQTKLPASYLRAIGELTSLTDEQKNAIFTMEGNDFFFAPPVSPPRTPRATVGSNGTVTFDGYVYYIEGMTTQQLMNWDFGRGPQLDNPKKPLCPAVDLTYTPYLSVAFLQVLNAFEHAGMVTGPVLHNITVKWSYGYIQPRDFAKADPYTPK